MPAKTKPAVGILLGLGLGVLGAGLGTVMHQTQVSGIPLGIFLSLGLAKFLATWLRRKYNRLAVFTYAFVLSLLIIWTGFDFHKDKMIPANLAGYLWGYGSIVIVLLVAAFPRLSKSSWNARNQSL